MPLDSSGRRLHRPLNLPGGRLEPCSYEASTGGYRHRCCAPGPEDVGSHTVCVEMTAAFLAFSRVQGNDLGTPRPEFGFAGLQPGDRWCLCAPRWQEAFVAGAAPRVLLRATAIGALEWCELDDLKGFSVDLV